MGVRRNDDLTTKKFSAGLFCPFSLTEDDMGDFYNTDCGADRLTAEELEKIALAGGVVGGIGYGSACIGELPAERHGYGFKWINRQGMGNHGDVVLTAKSAHAAAMLRQGKVAAWMAEFGLTYQAADSLYDATKRAHGREWQVIEYAVRTRRHAAWATFPGCMNGVWGWFKRWNMPETTCSAGRLDAVAAVIKAWV